MWAVGGFFIAFIGFYLVTEKYILPFLVELLFQVYQDLGLSPLTIFDPS